MDCYRPATVMKPVKTQEEERRPNLKHGLYTMKRALRVLGSRGLPAGNTALGRELRAWRQSLLADLGGPDAVSTQQLAIIEKAVTQKLIVDSLDAHVLGMGSLVNKRHRTLWPVVRERAAQVTLLQSLLRDLGLERRAKDANVAVQLAALHRPPVSEETRKPGHETLDVSAANKPENPGNPAR